LFIMARRGRSRRDIPWPEITHPRGNWKPAWSIIDWSKPCPSIFTRKRPLAEKTLRRIEAGLRKFCGQAFQLRTAFKGGNHRDKPPRSIDEPATITANHGPGHVVMPLVDRSRIDDRMPPDSPAFTATIGDREYSAEDLAKMAQASPFLLDTNHGDDGRSGERVYSATDPLRTVSTVNGKALCLPFLTKQRDRRRAIDQ
jgi:DNA (cytosine-5)-methyltransferase 1